MFKASRALPILLLGSLLNQAFATVECGGRPAPTRIWRIQGDGAVSPLSGQVVEIEGVVVGAFPGPGALNGFYLQEEAADSDGNPATSDGVFIHQPGKSQVRAGDVVRVQGAVSELVSGASRLTQIAPLAGLKVCAHGSAVEPVTISLPIPEGEGWERYEGMLVRIAAQGPLVVTGNHDLGRFGSVEIAPGRLFAPTQLVNPGGEARLRQSLNDRSLLIVDDGSNLANANLYPARYPAGGLRHDRTLRVGDVAAAPVAGIHDVRFGAYRLQPVAPVVFAAANPRPAAPPAAGGRIRVAAANVLNFFTTLGGEARCGPLGNVNCRGAGNEAEYQRQLKKIVALLAGTGADILVLNEIENNAAGAPHPAVDALVNALNAAAGGDAYRAIATGPLGTDAIRNAILYRPARVTPVGRFATAWLNDQNRPSLAQTFEPAGAARPELQRFTIVANHWKSKSGSCPGDGEAAFGQGACNFMRLRMARHVVTWLDGNPTADPAPPAKRKILLLGDFNSYAREDPIRAMTDPGFSLPGYPPLAGATYKALVSMFLGTGAYSYNYRGQSGYLDHAFASPALAPLVTAVTEWHVNADEPAALDYNLEGKDAAAQANYYDPGPFRSSDHDPLIVGFNPLAGDLDDDGDIDGRDHARLRAAMGKPASSAGAGRRMDFDGDGRITRQDERLWTKLRKAFEK